MEALVGTVSNIALFFVIVTDAVPPEACFATFRWEDCGQAPQPVMYYWKPGSRCEVGIWRGCLPNINMFKDEYECVSTCIFSVRAQAPDFHILQSEEVFKDDDTTSTTATSADSDTTSTTDSAGGTDGGEGNPTDNPAEQPEPSGNSEAENSEATTGDTPAPTEP